MDLITWFSPAPPTIDLPKEFPSPFSHIPHPIAKRAANELQVRLSRQNEWRHDFDAVDGGKMFAVLVVKDADNNVGFLSAFATTLADKWLQPGFVPPVFDPVERGKFLSSTELKLTEYGARIDALECSVELKDLRHKLQQLTQARDTEVDAMKRAHKERKIIRHKQRIAATNQLRDERENVFSRLASDSQKDKRALQALKTQWHIILMKTQTRLDEINAQLADLQIACRNYSRAVQEQLFSKYELTNRLGERCTISQLFKDKMPLKGAGDCAAVKLIHYANQHNFQPVAMAAFWWGASPVQEIRHHGHYYPASRGKCRPILPFMLKGLELESVPSLALSFNELSKLEIVYEDDDLVIVNKPSGLLSVPGTEMHDSVLTWLQQRYPNATGPLLVHRLDMSTSGLLMAAKNAEAHKKLQHQFERRSIEKRYVAVLSKPLLYDQDNGNIALPIRPDLYDRPRHMVCFFHGKPAKTQWQVISRDATTTRVHFYPKTGRTHQLRVHAAHKDRLNAPIVGDELYSQAGERLLLHAERLCFIHPHTGERITINSPAPF